MFEYEIQYLSDDNIWQQLKDWVRPIINKNTLDETHDETQIFLSCSPLDTPFKPFTRFIINITEKDESGTTIDTDTLYRVVIADEIQQKTFGETKLYDHDIRLAEASKELERYTVDNLSFTNEWNKAFQTRVGNAYISNVYMNLDWYVNQPLISSNDIFYYVNKFSSYNSNDSGYITTVPFSSWEIPSDKTSIYKTMYQYNTAGDFSFDSEVSTSYAQGSVLVVPNLTATNISTYPIAYLPDGLFKWDAYYTFRNTYGNIILVDPLGNETIVNSHDNIILSIQGTYKLKYTVTRQERTRITYKVRSLNIFESEDFFGWYNGLTTELTFEIDCKNGSPTTDKLSIYDILNKLTSTTPTRFTNDNNLRYLLHSSIEDRYASIEAPEMIFTNKNLWEALKEIGGVINAIPYLHITDQYNWNIIDFMPLSSENEVSENVEEEYCNSESYYDSENYTASFDMTVDNMVNPVSTKEGFINEGGYSISKSIRSEEVEISETSMDIETVYPIYKINTLKYVNYSLTPSIYDITNDVQEFALYNALVSNTVSSGKARTLYYKQGKPNIYGLQYKVSKDTYSNAYNKIAIKEIVRLETGITLTTEELLQSKFIIEYVPYLNARIKIFKPNAPKLNIDTSMFQNQSANVLDANALGRKMVANIGRIGNLGYVDSIKVYHLNRVPLKGQRSKDNYYVSTVTTEYDKNHILSSIQYTKDYQKISDFVNIQNLQRYYEISEKQSIHRYINTNMFYIFGEPVAEIQKMNALNNNTGYPQVNYLASLFIDQNYNRKINASILTAYSMVNNIETMCSRVYLNSNALAIGNSINIITDYQDNYGAGDQAVQYSVTDNNITTQAFMNRAVPYSDDKGKVKRIVIENITDSNIVYPSGNQALENNINKLAKSLPAITDLDNDIKPVGNDYINIADQYISGSNMPTFSRIGCKQDINTLKDSREILHFNQQHHFVVNDESVIIGNAMTESCRFIQENKMKCRLVFLKNKIDAYEFKIKDSDIIQITLPPNTDIQPLAQSLISLGTEITSSNLENILSTTNNTDLLYILPNLQYDGQIVGLEEPAVAWAIITNDILNENNQITVKGNDLIIGKNQFINNTNLSGGDNTVALRINMSVTSEY